MANQNNNGYNWFTDPLFGGVMRKAASEREYAKTASVNRDPLAGMFTLPVDGKEVDIRHMTKADWKKIGF